MLSSLEIKSKMHNFLVIGDTDSNNIWENEGCNVWGSDAKKKELVAGTIFMAFLKGFFMW